MTAYRYSENWYNTDESVDGALTTAWTELNTRFRAISVIIDNNDSGDTLHFSFDGDNIHGRLVPGASLYIADKNISKLWIKAATSGISSWQVMAW
jgi:hypothetical protein